MSKQDYYKVKFRLASYQFPIILRTSKELFTKIDLEDDGVIYLKEIVLYLRAMNEDIDANLRVCEEAAKNAHTSS